MSFFTARASKPIIIYSDCQGLKQYQSRDIADIDNRRLFKIKSDLMTYNYEIRHVKGEANCIADCLSQHHEWVLAKDRQSDSQGGAGDGAKGHRDELCLRVFTESRHFLRDNPALRKL